MSFSQPIMNLGTLGSVSSGKSTLILSLTGVKTQRISDEKQRNITIKAGYCNMKVWSDSDNNFTSSGSNVMEMKDKTLKHYLSFVYCPGHQQLTQIMLGQVDLMSGAVTVISMAENVSTNSQLIEHLKAAKLAGIDKNIVCLNKCDLVPKETVISKYNEVVRLFSDLGLPEPLAIIPTSFNKKLNIEYLIKAIMHFFPPEDYMKEVTRKPFFSVSRSFDINKPGSSILDTKGGVFGGSLTQGKLSVGDRIVIKPGLVSNVGGKMVSQPITTKIISIMSEKSSLPSINPGGLMAIMTDINPHVTKADRMVGNVICLADDEDINVVEQVNLKINMLDKRKPLKVKEKVNIMVGPMNLVGIVTAMKKGYYSIKFSRPCCLKTGTKLYLATNNDKMSIIGTGELV